MRGVGWSGRRAEVRGEEKISAGLFASFRLKEETDRGAKTGRGSYYFTRGSRMNGKKIFGILAGLMLVFVLAWPLAAAEKSFDLTIPGCTE